MGELGTLYGTCCKCETGVSAVASRQQTRGTIEYWAKVIAVALLDDSCVASHAHTQRPSCRPGLGVQRPLRGQRGGQCVVRARKDRVQAIAGGLEDRPAVRFNTRTQQAVVASKGGLHRLRVLL